MHANKIRLLVMVLASASLVNSCKRPNHAGSQLASNTYDSVLTIAIGEELPTEIEHFVEVLTGKSSRMHDTYFSQTLPSFLNGKFKFSNDVTFETTKKNYVPQVGPVEEKQTDTYRGLVVGERVLVFRKQTAGGGAAQRGPWWTPVTSYPLSLLGSSSIEDKIKHGLQTQVYDKIETAQENARIDSLEISCSLIPTYLGFRDYVYNDKPIGLAWIIGDTASLGTASKIKAFANVSRSIVVAASTVRITNGVAQASRGEANFGTGMDVAMASLQGGLAIVGFANFKFSSVRTSASMSTDDIINSIDGHIFPTDAASARLISSRVKRSESEILAKGISKEELAVLTGKKVGPVSAVSNKAKEMARYLCDGIKKVCTSDLDVAVEQAIVNGRIAIPGASLDKPAVLSAIAKAKTTPVNPKHYGLAADPSAGFGPSVSNVVFLQSSGAVELKGLKDYFKSANPYGSTKRIELVQVRLDDGTYKYLALGGHHRIGAAILQGAKHLEDDFTLLTPYNTGVYSLDDIYEWVNQYAATSLKVNGL